MLTASTADMIARFDVRLLGQLVNDTNTPQTGTQLLTDPVLIAILEDASGVVLSALHTAYKYLDSDLATLDTESAAMLKRITCDIAFLYLANRRGFDTKDKMAMLEDSYFLLQKLRNGERVLNVAANEDAGNTHTAIVTVVDQAIAGLVSTNFRYFPACRCISGAC